MRRRFRLRLAERRRRVRRLLAIWRRRDPKAWIVALMGMVLGLCLFLLQLALTEAFHLLAQVMKSLR